NKVFGLLFKTEHVFEYEIESVSDKLVLPYAGFKVLLFYYMLLIRDATPEGGVIKTKVHNSEQPMSDDEALWVSIDIYSETSPETANRMIAAEPISQCFCHSLSIQAAQRLVLLWGGNTVLNYKNQEMPIIRLTLPAAQAKPKAFINDYKRQESKPHSDESPKILLLEDQDAICKFIHELLQDEGFESVVFKSGHQLDSALPRLDLDTFQLFLLDIFVPGSSGLELAMRIREKKPDAKLLFYSALTNLDTVEKLFPLGPTTMFMPKPFKKEELIANIHEMLEVESV
ncbi:response regulator, partial [bacterium]|nr:response regulator [bacterium]